MWRVEESRKCLKQLKKCPQDVIRQYETWREVIEQSGPIAVRAIRGYRDHGLRGEWEGARSSYLNLKWRVIYIVKGDLLEVTVLEVDPHEY
jgi:addiction module RelE/StbE family toxin